MISPAAMKRAIVITAILTFLSAVLLIYTAFGLEYLYYSIFFLLLGIIAIASAIRYTVGKSAYGYKGYGDIFVFVFFGLVSTYGSYFMFSKVIDWYLLLPAIAIGFLSVGVLNLNNMRDEFSDKKAGKNTIVVKIGGTKAKQYHYFLVITAMILLLVFGILQHFAIDQYIYLIVFLPIISHLLRVSRTQNPADLDPELKRLAISTFMVSLLLSLCLIYFISDIIV